MELDDDLTVALHEVERKIGRCILQLQAYERLLKTLIASAVVEGMPEQMQAIHDQNMADVRTQTLGTLVGMFTHSVLSPALPTSEEATAANGAAEARFSDAANISLRFTMAMPPEHYAQVKAGLKELVDLRNSLVHHFFDRFGKLDIQICAAACDYLDSCYQRIKADHERMKGWAAAFSDSWALMASFIGSPEFENAFVHGIQPDGTVLWSRSTIVDCLRNAEDACALDGWTLLDTAIAFIGQRHRDQTPARYRCKTWREVLRKSEQFEVRSEKGTKDRRGQIWYRSLG